MKKLKLGLLLLIVALGAAVVGSAALSSIAFDRNVSAGRVLVDTDPNVAIQITNISSYSGLVKTEADGQVSFHLNEAISDNSGAGLNTDAIYTIGSASSGVIRIKNNSDVAVEVVLTNDVNNLDAITLAPVNGASNTIEVGRASDFYFTVNTHGQDAGKDLKAILSVNGQK